MIVKEDEMIHFCQRLLQTASSSGQEEQMAGLLAQTMTSLGYDEVRTDRLGNVIGRIKGRGQGATVLFDGHMDSVPADSSQWTRPPYGGEIWNGKMYGRGASDMKGSLAAMVYAAAQLKLAGIVPEGDVYVAGTVCQELFEGVALKAVMDEVKPDVVIIGQATGLNLNIGQRGRAELRVTAMGQSAHSSNPEAGRNAVDVMLAFLEQATAIPPQTHDQLGQSIAVITDIVSSPYPGSSVIPDRCTVTIDRRLLPGEQEAKVLEQYRSIDPSIKVEIAEQTIECYTGCSLGGRRFYPAWLMQLDDPVVNVALKALHGQGIPAKIGSYQYCTSGSYSAGIANIPTIGFGPSEEQQAHTVDEYIEIEQLAKSAQGYYALAKAFALITKE
ncbi:YgeY family selenium metabolism-linked hydrolase [Paenibacillus sp. SAF-054]|uniref:YgeY family selenium metabolism-linked hydrolase n=1 Tax=unclassified Paenibacillus TaxID=185978 RepID=UPI003F7E9D8A